MRISDWSSDVCSSDLIEGNRHVEALRVVGGRGTIVHHDQLIRYDLQEAHETGEALLLALEHAHHVEAPHPALADIGLVVLDGEAVGPYHCASASGSIQAANTLWRGCLRTFTSTNPRSTDQV